MSVAFCEIPVGDPEQSGTMASNGPWSPLGGLAASPSNWRSMRLLAANSRPKPFFETGVIEADDALGLSAATRAIGDRSSSGFPKFAGVVSHSFAAPGSRACGAGKDDSCRQPSPRTAHHDVAQSRSTCDLTPSNAAASAGACRSGH